MYNYNINLFKFLKFNSKTVLTKRKSIMKKSFVLVLATVFSISLFYSCGNAEETKDDSADTSADTKEKAEKKADPELVLKLDGEKVHFDKAELSYDDMFGPQLTVSAFLDPDEEEVGTVTMTQSFFSINIEDLELGKMEKTNISLRDYNVSNASSEVHKLEIGSDMYGPKIDAIELDFSATLHDKEGEEFSLTGKYNK